MAFAWKASGLTYNRYLAVAARVVRRSLKQEHRLQAERRGEMDLKFAKWEWIEAEELTESEERQAGREQESGERECQRDGRECRKPKPMIVD